MRTRVESQNKEKIYISPSYWLSCRVCQAGKNRDGGGGDDWREDGMPGEVVITIEVVEEVVLFWDTVQRSKGVRELAMGASEGVKDDVDRLKYYR